MLVLDALTTSYDAFRLGPISLTVDDEVVAVVGPSGCGKTTLLATIAGLRTPDAGTVELDGRDLTDDAPETRGTAMVFQDGALFPHMTARENIAYAGAPPARIDRIADRLGITAVLDQPAPTLSAGQRQRVALARALVADPGALLLDEPLANLDAHIKRRLRDELADLFDDISVPAVYVTHDLREAATIGDRIVVMADGDVHQIGRADEVFARPATPFVASFTGADNVFEGTVRRADDDVVLQWGPNRLRTHETGLSPGTSVRFTVRPERVEAAEADGASAIPVTVIDRVFEGDTYRVEITPDGVDATLEWLLLPPAYDRLGLADRDAVRVRLPPSAIHVLSHPSGD